MSEVVPTPAARLEIQKGSLASLDKLGVDALALYFFAERAQPRAIPGLIDWRLAGRLGRLLQSGRFSGEAGESLLMPGMKRIGAARIFLFGLGAPRSRIDGGMRLTLTPTIEALKNAGVTELAVAAAPIKGSLDGSLEGELGLRWLEASKDVRPAFSRVVLIELADELSRMGPRISGAGREAGLAG